MSGPLITCRVICSYMEGVALSRIIDEVYFPMDTLQFGRGGWPSTFKSIQTVCALFLLVDSKAALSQLNNDQS